MENDPDPDLSRLLEELQGADRRTAMRRLLPLVYGELRALAGAQMGGERPDHTLQPTALVHEAYLRLMGRSEANWSDRAHFFRAAAEAMRRILIDHARRRSRIKRGGGERVLPLDSGRVPGPSEDEPEEILALDEAIQRLYEQDPRTGDVVRLRYFAGLSVQDTARALGISERTVKRDWAFARAFLHEELGASR